MLTTGTYNAARAVWVKCSHVVCKPVWRYNNYNLVHESGQIPFEIDDFAAGFLTETEKDQMAAEKACGHYRMLEGSGAESESDSDSDSDRNEEEDGEGGSEEVEEGLVREDGKESDGRGRQFLVRRRGGDVFSMGHREGKG